MLKDVSKTNNSNKKIPESNSHILIQIQKKSFICNFSIEHFHSRVVISQVLNNSGIYVTKDFPTKCNM